MDYTKYCPDPFSTLFGFGTCRNCKSTSSNRRSQDIPQGILVLFQRQAALIRTLKVDTEEGEGEQLGAEGSHELSGASGKRSIQFNSSVTSIESPPPGPHPFVSSPPSSSGDVRRTRLARHGAHQVGGLVVDPPHSSTHVGHRGARTSPLSPLKPVACLHFATGSETKVDAELKGLASSQSTNILEGSNANPYKRHTLLPLSSMRMRPMALHLARTMLKEVSGGVPFGHGREAEFGIGGSERVREAGTVLVLVWEVEVIDTQTWCDLFSLGLSHLVELPPLFDPQKQLPLDPGHATTVALTSQCAFQSGRSMCLPTRRCRPIQWLSVG